VNRVVRDMSDTPSTAVVISSPVAELEVRGWTLLRGALSQTACDAVLAECALLELRSDPHNPHRKYAHEVQWLGLGAVLDTVASSTILGFLKLVFGDDLVCLGASYFATHPGYAGMVVHADYQPYGSRRFGQAASCPVVVRALVSLDGMAPNRAPFEVLPYSHLSLHADANPYRLYQSHPDLEPVSCEAGDAVLFNHRLFHRAGANTSAITRRVLTIGYRPAHLGPVRRVPAAPRELDRLPGQVRRLFEHPNRGRDATEMASDNGIAAEASGLSANRWQSKVESRHVFGTDRGPESTVGRDMDRHNA
jgi:hypothetical protein